MLPRVPTFASGHCDMPPSHSTPRGITPSSAQLAMQRIVNHDDNWFAKIMLFSDVMDQQLVQTAPSLVVSDSSPVASIEVTDSFSSSTDGITPKQNPFQRLSKRPEDESRKHSPIFSELLERRPLTPETRLLLHPAYQITDEKAKFPQYAQQKWQNGQSTQQLDIDTPTSSTSRHVPVVTPKNGYSCHIALQASSPLSPGLHRRHTMANVHEIASLHSDPHVRRRIGSFSEINRVQHGDPLDSEISPTGSITSFTPTATSLSTTSIPRTGISPDTPNFPSTRKLQHSVSFNPSIFPVSFKQTPGIRNGPSGVSFCTGINTSNSVTSLDGISSPFQTSQQIPSSSEVCPDSNRNSVRLSSGYSSTATASNPYLEPGHRNSLQYPSSAIPTTTSRPPLLSKSAPRCIRTSVSSSDIRETNGGGPPLQISVTSSHPGSTSTHATSASSSGKKFIPNPYGVPPPTPVQFPKSSSCVRTPQPTRGLSGCSSIQPSVPYKEGYSFPSHPYVAS